MRIFTRKRQPPEPFPSLAQEDGMETGLSLKHGIVEVRTELHPWHIRVQQLSIPRKEKIDSCRRRTSQVNRVTHLELLDRPQSAEGQHGAIIERQEDKTHFAERLANHRSVSGTGRCAHPGHQFSQPEITGIKRIATIIRLLQQSPHPMYMLRMVFQKIYEEHRVPIDSAHSTSSSCPRTQRMNPSAP